MKQIVIMVEGAADVPLPELEGKTPLEVARCEIASQLAAGGQSGLLDPVQEGLDGRDEVTMAAIFGLPDEDALKVARGPLEAMTVVEDLDGYDMAYRGDFVTVSDGRLRDPSPGHLSEEETTTLVEKIQASWRREDVRFEITGPGRCAVLLREPSLRGPAGHPSAYVEGEEIDSFWPHGRDGELLRMVMERANEQLPVHPVNEVRLDLGENPANALWCWGGGSLEVVKTALSGRGKGKALLAPGRLAQGFAQVSGATAIPLQSPWDMEVSTPLLNVGEIVGFLQEGDDLLVYVPAPRELGIYGTGLEKVRALDRFDQLVLGPLLELLDAFRPYRLLLASDGLVSSEDRHPSSGDVPLVLYGEGVEPDATTRWSEAAAAEGRLGHVKVLEALHASVEV